MLGCEVCGGPLVVLGTLGTRDWFRCRNCGADQSVEANDPDPDEDDDDGDD